MTGRFLTDVVTEIARRWPGSKVKKAARDNIRSLGAPWRCARGAVARGVSDLRECTEYLRFLTRLTRAQFAESPDTLSRAPRRPKFIPVCRVAQRLASAGIDLSFSYPVGGPYGERMTMAYFPELKILYGADLVFPGSNAGAGYLRTPALDLRRAVERESLVVETLFCVQPTVPPLKWSDFVPSGMAR